jgi:hypothetical protein
MLKRGEIKSLTGLRGVAACAVVLYHYQGSDAGLGRFVLHGYTAVDLFFALSGFVMALTYAGAFADGFGRGREDQRVVRQSGAAADAPGAGYRRSHPGWAADGQCHAADAHAAVLRGVAGAEGLVFLIRTSAAWA